MEETKIKLIVTKSNCLNYQLGDVIYFDGPLIDKEKSAKLCITAISAIYPFVYAARKGIIRDTPLQCPDCGESVEFSLKADL